ncbi:MAG: outer membrane beta-barrel protein [Muribaculaceae bacterium]|nr:outer membrane beta-barrel protein [Muribaculaceae bacterium]
MKNKILIFSLASVSYLASGFSAGAQRFEIKPHATIGLGKGVDLESTLPMVSEKGVSNEFGVDFGYTFWESGANSLNVNIGLGYRTSSLKFRAQDMKYRYSAPPSADMDGDTYIRYYDVNDLEQKIGTGHFNIPLYLGYEYRINDWFNVYADLGFNFGIKCKATLNHISGSIDTYGIYPQYGDNFEIKDPFMNGFGEHALSSSMKGKISANSFMPSFLVGAGVETKIWGPLWFMLGFRYDCGFNNMFKNLIEGTTPFTASTAPVTYTVKDGERVTPISDYLNKSRLSVFSLNFGFSVKF